MLYSSYDVIATMYIIIAAIVEMLYSSYDVIATMYIIYYSSYSGDVIQ